jgi:hypothetical protein
LRHNEETTNIPNRRSLRIYNLGSPFITENIEHKTIRITKSCYPRMAQCTRSRLFCTLSSIISRGQLIQKADDKENEGVTSRLVLVDVKMTLILLKMTRVSVLTMPRMLLLQGQSLGLVISADGGLFCTATTRKAAQHRLETRTRGLRHHRTKLNKLPKEITQRIFYTTLGHAAFFYL